MQLTNLVKVSLDELRMQMLGTQVLFGFQLQSVFQENFARLSKTAHTVGLFGLSMIVVTLGLLIAGPAQHRIVDGGNDTKRIFNVATRFAEIALFPFGLAIGCDIYVIGEPFWGSSGAAISAAGATATALVFWYGLGLMIRSAFRTSEEIRPMPRETKTDCHTQIDQMLTEARVILPGAQALMGFQFVVTMTKAFTTLSHFDRDVHFAALSAVALSVILLITPAAVHRLAFAGQDIPLFHKIGSALVTVALLPLAIGISGDFYVATAKMTGNSSFAAGAASLAGVLLIAFWYALPTLLRAKRRAGTTGDGLHSRSRLRIERENPPS